MKTSKVPRSPELSPTPPAQAPADTGATLALSALGLALLSTGLQAAPLPVSYQGVVVMDDFSAADHATTHGELVEHELNRGGLNCQAPIHSERHQVSNGISMEALKRGQPGSLENYVREHFVFRMSQTSGALRQEYARPGRRVLSQSQGASESRAFEAVWGARREPGVLRTLGLEPTAGDKEIAQALLGRIRQVHLTDPAIRQAREELHSLRGDEVRVLSAGNQGRLHRELTEMGLELDATFFANELATPGSIIVGAADGQGPAAIANPLAGAMLAADGVEREMCVDGKVGKHTGSSYAQPQVARRIDDYLLAEPGLTQDQINQRLLSEVHPVEGESSRLGAGILPDYSVQH